MSEGQVRARVKRKGTVLFPSALNGSPLPALQRGRLHMGTVTHAEAWTVPQTNRAVPPFHADPERNNLNEFQILWGDRYE